MIAKEDLELVADGDRPSNILALVQLGYATYPPPRLTDAGRELLDELRSDSDGM
jgi:hypothetical protein